MIPHNATFFRVRNQPFFTGKIIDAHGHVGKFHNEQQNGWKLDTYKLNSISAVLPRQTDQDIEKVLVSNLSCISNTVPGGKGLKTFKDEYQGNKQLLLDCQQTPGFFPIAVAQPRLDTKNAADLNRLLSEYPKQFYGLKFHPDYLGLDANNAAYDAHLNLAERYNLPCVFHSAPGPSAPEKIYELARRHPDVPVVLYHMNMAPGVFVKDLPSSEIFKRHLQNSQNQHCWEHRELWNREGITVVEEALRKKDANLYLEVSWAKPETVVEAIKRVGPTRVIWGSDAPFLELRAGKEVSYAQRIEEVETAIRASFGSKASDIIDQIFYRNSQELFFKSTLERASVKKNLQT